MSLTAEHTAVVVGQLQWSSAAIVSVASAGDDPRLAAIVALLQQQTTRWANQLPESVLLRPADRVAPASAVTRDALDAAGNISSAQLVGVIAHCIRQLERELEALARRLGPVADAPLGRAIDESRAELRHAFARLGAGVAPESPLPPTAELLAQVERGRFVTVPITAEG